MQNDTKTAALSETKDTADLKDWVAPEIETMDVSETEATFGGSGTDNGIYSS